MNSPIKNLVAVIGAGPAGLFAARELAAQNMHVFLFNRDIKPGGLAEYGVYPDKLKMKGGLRNQFRQIVAMPNVEYYGNITIGKNADLTIQNLRELGFQAILITCGAQGTKWLGLEGESLTGVYHAKDLVYFYNKLPPFTERKFIIGKRVAIIGVGNVMMDITHYLISLGTVDEVIAVARRGPAEVKFDRKELETVIANVDVAAFDQEVDRVEPIMRSLGQEPDLAKQFIHSAVGKGGEKKGQTRCWMHFLASPTRILDNGMGSVGGLEVEDNTIIINDGEVKAQGLGTRHILDVDTVIFAIGDRVDENLGLPVHRGGYDKNPMPRFPIEGESYEAYDNNRNQPVEDVFVAGWSRLASTGLVGLARRDGTNGARALSQYLHDKPEVDSSILDSIRDAIYRLGHPIVNEESLAVLERVEQERAKQLGLEEFKFSNNQDMLEVMGLLTLAP